MRTAFSILFFIQSITILSSQIVGTFAGVRDSIGALDGPASEATFYNPHGIAISQTGNIYICDRFNHIIRKISPNGQVTTLAGTAGIIGDADGNGSAAKFYEPWGICVDHNENVFVADTRNNKIKKIETDGTVTTFAGTGNFGTTNGPLNACTFGQPVGIESDGQGNFYVADHATHIIRKISLEGEVTTLAGTAYSSGYENGMGTNAKFNKPYGLTLDLDGNILVADEHNHAIRKITPEGEVSTLAGIGTPGEEDGIATVATFKYPWDVTVDSSGLVYVADGLNYAIRKIIPDGDIEVETLAGIIGSSGSEDGLGTNARFSGATGIAFSPLTRELYIGDAFNNLIRKITDPSQGIFLTIENNITSLCPDEIIEFNAYPDVYQQFHFYIDNELVESSSIPYFDTLGLPSGQHLIKVVASLDTFQVTSEDFVVDVFTTVQATIDTIGATTFFEGDSVILISSFGIEYFWSNGADSPIITVKESGTYSVEVTDANECTTNTSEVEVTVRSDPEEITIEADGTLTICEGDYLNLYTNQTINVQWLLDGWPIEGANQSNYQARDPGVYQVSYMDSFGTVVISDLLEIMVLPQPLIDFTADKNNIKPNESVQLFLIGDSLSTVEWDFGNNIKASDFSPILKYEEEGDYDVSLFGIAENGCSTTITKSSFISVNINTTNQSEDDVFVASAFTPNDDGINDVLFVRGLDVANMNIKIFNQRGTLIFESSSKNNGWDGSFKNKKAPIGNYIFSLKYTNLIGMEKQIIGKIALLK